MNKKLVIIFGASAFVLFAGIVVYSRIQHIEDINTRAKKIYQAYQKASGGPLIDERAEIDRFIQKPFKHKWKSLYKGPRACGPFSEWPYEKSFNQWKELVKEDQFSVCLKTLELKPSPLGAFLARGIIFNYSLDGQEEIKNYSASALYHLINVRRLADYGLEDNQAVLSMAMALLEKEAKFYLSYKHLIFALAVNRVVYNKDSKGIEAAFRMARRLKAEDGELFELDIMYHFLREQDEKKMVNRLLKHSRQYPNDGRSLYLLSYYYWSQDEPRKSAKLLDLAIEREQEKRFLETRQKMQALSINDTSQNIFFTPLQVKFHHFKRD